MLVLSSSVAAPPHRAYLVVNPHPPKTRTYVYRYSTVCYLAGIDPTDNQAGVPAIDSVNVWASLLVPNASETPRTVVPLATGGLPSVRATIWPCLHNSIRP